MQIHNVTLSEHLKKYMPGLPENVLRQLPLQAVALEQIKSHLKYPTPLFKPQYNIILHITRGEIRAQVGIDKIAAKKHSVLLMLSNKIVAREYMSKDLEGFCIIAEEAFLVKLLNKRHLLKLFETHPAITLHRNAHQTIASLNGLLVKEQQQRNHNMDFAAATLQAMLTKLLEQSAAVKSLSRQEEIAFGFKQLLYRHFQEQHHMLFYARELSVSENYLGRCTKSVFLKSPKELWMQAIIQKSQLLLQDNSNEISEIAYLLNFNDPSYFGRLFKQVTGCAPTVYRLRVMHGLSEH